MKKTLTLFLSFFGMLLNSSLQALEDLPPILEIPPAHYEILGPIGATMKTLDEAQIQLQREAKKLDADAIIFLSCQKGGLKGNGFGFDVTRPYCKGKAIRIKGLDESRPHNILK
ncbi:MAG: hypothetical protein JNK65_07000 [Deltaproteobacteria bacterium]|nr:hypothetical protein [Deltaproteobacteria bacterium]